MKRILRIRLLLGLLMGQRYLLGSVLVKTDGPVRIEARTAQNETVSYIYAESHALVIGVSHIAMAGQISRCPQ